MTEEEGLVDNVYEININPNAFKMLNNSNENEMALNFESKIMEGYGTLSDLQRPRFWKRPLENKKTFKSFGIVEGSMTNPPADLKRRMIYDVSS